jgi:hypothetical protein
VLERFNSVGRVVGAGLAALVVVQALSLLLRKDPLAGLDLSAAPLTVSSPEIPSTRPETNAAARRAPIKLDTNLPPAVQARLERITQSEILGPVMRPLPMALLGIAGLDAFLRAPNGQSGLLREGEQMGGIKLLRIGTNRVLIEHEHEQKELTLFSGFGGETLGPKAAGGPTSSVPARVGESKR